MRLAVIALLVLAGCASTASHRTVSTSVPLDRPATSADRPSATTPYNTVVGYPRRVSTATIDSYVMIQLEGSPSTIVEVAPGIYRRPSDGLLLGRCDVVRPYAQEHGTPNDFYCY